MSRTTLWIGLAALALVALLWLLVGGGPRIEEGSALVVDLQGTYVETSQSPLVSRLVGDGPQPLISLLSALSKAERDERLRTVVFRIRGLDVGWGKAQEIRDAILRLSAAGRETVAWLEVERFGPHLEYYVATAADEIYTAPSAFNPLVGLAAEYLFLGGLFEKLGVEIEYERIGRFKSAVETFAGEKMSEPNREMTTALLDSIEGQFLGDVARERGIELREVSEAIDESPVDPQRMLHLDLIDGVAFFDELMERIGDPPRVTQEEYARVDPSEVGFDPVASVALVYGAGAVVAGEDGAGPGGGPVFAAETVAGAIEDASEDPEVRGILLRIDSPGGSALASDRVWRAIRRARAAGTPVVVSFSDVAASGGYYVAVAADRIVTQPATFTGSIGVFVLRPVLGGLLGRLGIGVETMTRGRHADLLTSSQPLSPRTRALLRSNVSAVYSRFLERVAEGRELSVEQVDELGQGRVYTGQQAEALGLVDALGGMRAAVGELKREIGLDPDDDVVLVGFPPPQPLALQIRELLGIWARRELLGSAPLARLGDVWRTLVALEPGVPLLVPPGVPVIR